MGDRELLELAAKAAGVHANQWAEPDTLLPGKGGWVQFIGYGQASIWNPLTDDGDALRLAVKLEMDIFVRGGRWVEAVGPMSAPAKEMQTVDQYEAARRAIVRAAAALAPNTPPRPAAGEK